MTGYEEILTDPSYAGQIITFTFPHIGIVGVNDEDIETVNLAATPGARGIILHSWRSPRRRTTALPRGISMPGSRAAASSGLPASTPARSPLCIRVKGMPNAVIAHQPSGRFDLDALQKRSESVVYLGRHGPRADGHDRPALHLAGNAVGLGRRLWRSSTIRSFTSVAVDYGIKRNILRQLAGNRCCKVTVVPAQTSAADAILALGPDGIFCRMVRAIRRRRVRTPCRSSAR